MSPKSELELHPSSETSISGLAQSLRFALEQHEYVTIRAIGEKANYITVKALAGANKLMDKQIIFTVDWNETDTKEGKRTTLLYTIFK